jgi:DNA-directed RNA polymerase subunit E'/Rpb7
MAELNNIYFTTIIKKSIILDATQQSGDINDNILKIVKKEYEGKCIVEGYVKPDSCIVTKRSLLKLVPNILSGTMYTDLRIKADICLPVKGNVLNCTVDKINKMGLLAKEGPLIIAVPRSFHKDKDVFKDIQVGSKIKIEIIDSRFEINWDHIDVIAQLYDPTKHKKKKSDIKIIQSDENSVDLLAENEPETVEVPEEGEGDGADEIGADEIEDEEIEEIEDLDEDLAEDDDILEDDVDDDQDQDQDPDPDQLLDEEQIDDEGNMLGGGQVAGEDNDEDEDEDEESSDLEEGSNEDFDGADSGAGSDYGDEEE